MVQVIQVLLAGLTVWFLVALYVGIKIGRFIREADRFYAS